MRKAVYVTVFSLCWAIGIFLNKILLNTGQEPLSLTWISTVLTAVALTGYVLIKERTAIFHLDARTLKRFMLVGVFISIAYVSAVFGLCWSTSINYSFLVKSSMIFVIILAHFFLRERITRQKAILAAGMIIGVFLLTTNGKLIVPHAGDLLILLNGFCFGAATVVQKRMTDQVSATIIGWGRVFFAMLALLVLTPLVIPNFSQLVRWDLIILLAIINSLVAIYLAKTLEVASASYLTMMSMLTPVLNTILGYTLLHEQMLVPQIIGAVMIIVSGMLTHRFNL